MNSTSLAGAHGMAREERLAALGEMCAALAHEIRNPLGSMELYCSLLKKDLKSQPELYELAENVHLGIRSIERIVSNCLEFARERFPARERISDVEEFLHRAVRLIEAKLVQTDIKVQLHCSGNGEPYVDPYQVQQAVINLLANAIDASVGLSSEVVVSSSFPHEGTWRIEVTDAGKGMTSQEAERAKEPFFTTKTKGTGLGLAIVQSIVQAHGGEFIISSNGQRGTSARIDLPWMIEEKCNE